MLLATRIVALAALLSLAACTPMPHPAAPSPPPVATAGQRAPITVLVSIDAFRPDYRGHGLTPNLDAIAAQGLSGTMTPSFPTLTFPNHYAMATGLRPDRNGIVENKMRDPARPDGLFESKEKSSADPFWWDQAEPIWVTAEKAGIRTGILFYPGSDRAIRGTRPGIWLPFDGAITSEQRIDFLLDWARRPAPDRPRFLSVYFDAVDKAGHAHGAGAPETDAAIREVDSAIGRLRREFAAMGQPINLLVVSDHGLGTIPPEHVLPLANIVDRSVMDVMTAGGPAISVWPKPGQEAKVAAMLLRPHPHLQCWRREDLPARFHYGHNPRVPPFYCVVQDRGWIYVDKVVTTTVGDHGYDNENPDMTALFLATGPAFPKKATLPKFDNVDVYPLLRELIGLPPQPDIDGTVAPFRGLARP
ncbi:ectonucleotide pyrophosphatase/phosphodiesterase [Sphingomonas sp. BIUV-7]|uniref:Ectonucleotide pyrophosphatase/phosphodiesterase n=1 Tax=Sphingomonas natans TaxID=3063330 RepID=A0ABT8YB06_9SPHN|nr:ectonucleotide pyrophosphatase/phosphodiesterase [Sphingomonas sp. BIUV-7]MDO6415522.1 ectonucleotide pyrophosphatase/phosphodiesterase [Sphingomonas sp. BIUV-7]